MQWKKQLIYQGHQCGAIHLPEGCYDALFSDILNNVLVLVVVILNTCNFIFQQNRRTSHKWHHVNPVIPCQMCVNILTLELIISNIQMFHLKEKWSQKQPLLSNCLVNALLQQHVHTQ
jgi:hypothetical protein